MREIVTTMTKRGQVTVPAEIRRLLGLKAYDKVAFVVEDDQVRIKPAEFTVKSVRGSVRALDTDLDFDEQIRLAKEEKAERTVRELL